MLLLNWLLLFDKLKLQDVNNFMNCIFFDLVLSVLFQFKIIYLLQFNSVLFTLIRPFERLLDNMNSQNNSLLLSSN